MVLAWQLLPNLVQNTATAGHHEKTTTTAHKGKVQLTIIFSAPADQVVEGDRIFESHAKWMAKTHHREGKKALLRYNLTKGAEEPLKPVVRADRQYLLRSDGGVRESSRCGKPLEAGC